MYPSNALGANFLVIGGRVQGVGFRPFVFRLAHDHGLTGWVRNRNGEVEVFVQGTCARLALFARHLISKAPPLARPVLLHYEVRATEESIGFVIRPSAGESSARAVVPPDYFACDDCLDEMRDPEARRYRYPFINCTQCGPRYTLITRLPYDRANTAMDDFPLCPACRNEYENPADRRFHAQPLACPVCGPHLQFRQGDMVADREQALQMALALLRAGEIVAVKGVGGYHLLCDARNDKAVMTLRTRKPRPHKPLAVIFPQRGANGLDLIRKELSLSESEAVLLVAPERPIVLCSRRAESSLAPSIAPGLNEVGAMLPYSPLHHLLLEEFDAPLVATSGNISGEPVITEAKEAEHRLVQIADAFLHHNRPILRPADDSVYRIMAGAPRPLRLGRGASPQEIRLPFSLNEPVLAVGAHTKNTVALALGDRAMVSPHIGDLDSPRARAVFERVIEDLQHFYGVKAQRVICDTHPGYASTRWAVNSGLPVSRVLHHHAHASALYGEYETTRERPWLVFTWDGVGYGEDGTLWGGEAFLGRPAEWQRVATLRSFRLPGGEKAGREPWRSALGLCWEAGISWPGAPEGAELLRRAWQQDMNAPATTAVGRLFDAAAAFTGILHSASFEGQGPMLLEATARRDATGHALPLRTKGDLLVMDWAPLLAELTNCSLSIAERSGRFHATLAASIVAVAEVVRARHGVDTIGLSGGVFQNRVLTEAASSALEAAGFVCHLSQRLPCNDGGISGGQIFEACWANPNQRPEGVAQGQSTLDAVYPSPNP
jgi:hydrogenase maturation protein HypF